MKKITIMGVTPITDSYPNTKYKIPLLKGISELDICENVYVLKSSGHFGKFVKAGNLFKALYIFKILYGHIVVLSHFFLKCPSTVYITYPGIGLGFLMSFIPTRVRPAIYLDAFISIYDTVVNDRQLIDKNDIRGKILYWIERRAFDNSYQILVDTEENRAFLSKCFDLPIDKFCPIPLTIPRLNKKQSISEFSGKFLCVFVGTFVPLQGVDVIVRAAKELSYLPDVHLLIIGDGQEAAIIENMLIEAESNITWMRGHFETDFIINYINAADICMGIFGTSEKAQRVVPLKIYYYMSLGKPIITASSKSIKRLIEMDAKNPFITVPKNNPGALAAMIDNIYHNQDSLPMIAQNARYFYKKYFGDSVVTERLKKVILG